MNEKIGFSKYDNFPHEGNEYLKNEDHIHIEQ